MSPAKKKRGYSREFPTTSAKRVSININAVPPALKRAAVAKAKRTNVSLRAKVLSDLQRWIDEPDTAVQS